MDARRVRSFVVFVTFLCGFAACCSGGNRKIADTFFSNAAPLNLDDIDEDTAEQVWIHCRTELKETTEAFEDFDLYFSQAGSNSFSNKIESEVAWLTRRTVQQAIGDLPPHVKQTLLDCVRKKNFPSHDHDKETEPSAWLIKYRELLSSWSSLSRRFLLRKKRPHTSLHAVIPRTDAVRRPFAATIRASAAPGPSSAPPAKAPGPASASPAHAPTPSDLVPASSPSPTSKPATKAPPPSLPVVLPPPRPRDSPRSPPNNDSNNKNLVIAVIAIGSVAAFLLIALILVCCLKGNKKTNDPKDGQRDEKPLLNLGSSDISPGSSQLSHGAGRRSSRKSFRLPSFRSNLSIRSNVHNSSLPEGQLSEASAVASLGGNGDVNASLPLPPGRAAPPPPAAAPPPPPPPKPPGPRPPPPPKASRLPNPPKSGNTAMPTPPVPNHHASSSFGEGSDQNSETDAPKTKLKPFFWDKVLANPDHSMVWHELRGGSFQVDEEMIESLFGVSAADRNKLERKKEPSAFEPPNQYIQVIDPKKAQNLAILLKALNVTTEEVCDAIKEGNELPVELVQTLLKMAPTTDEELKLRLFSGDLSQLGPAERFLKVLVDIPYAFRRLESLLFMSSLQEEVTFLKDAFATLEVACKALTNSRLFLKLLEAVLKTGNRMNDGTFRGGAQAFKLDTLLKLSDVKGTDGKTTLLHFVVQEIIRSEGVRAARNIKENQTIQAEDPPDDSTQEEAADYYRSLGLQVVSGLSNELVNVRKAALIDGETLTTSVSKLGHSLEKSREFLNGEMKTVEEDTKFHETLTSFVQNAEVDVMWLLEEEKRMMAQVRSTADYFHGHAGKDEGLRLFVTVRDFLIILDKVCKEVKNSAMAPLRNPRKDASAVLPSAESHQQTAADAHKRLFPTIKEQETDDFSSDDESPSSS